MDVVIGRIPPPGPTGDRPPDPAPQIEARVLHVRPGRRRSGTEKSGRKPHGQAADPPGSRVLVLMIPEAFRLPDDLTSDRWRVFLRFTRR